MSEDVAVLVAVEGGAGRTSSVDVVDDGAAPFTENEVLAPWLFTTTAYVPPL